jgi:glycerophosphoryl diester phosphodiesterase
MKQLNLPVYGLHGESHAAPMDTLVSYWAALGEGAEGITAGLQMTGDGCLVCCPSDLLTEKDGVPYRMSCITTKELRDFDAGASFRSTVLNQENQPTGETGIDTPWVGNTEAKDKPHLCYPHLKEVLQLFGRRTKLMFIIQDDVNAQHSEAIAQSALDQLRSFGLERRVTIAAPDHVCSYIHQQSPQTATALMVDTGKSMAKNLEETLQAGASYLYTNIESLDVGFPVDKLENVKLLLTSNTMPYAPTPAAYFKVLEHKNVHALVMRSVDRTRKLGDSPAKVLVDDFAGTEINRDIWACGYSHCNTDTTISQDNGFTITIKEGGSYSGGAAVTLLPILGNFDAQVNVNMASPQQGTTLEMSAIGIDPGYFHIDNTNLNSRTVSLTFDVHGAPPYASCERDENDGFRIGWNNGYNLTRISSDWTADSVNMYNKYGRDVGNGSTDNLSCTLRLHRCGAVFNSYYKDKYNKEWVCSGSALVPNLSADVHIRLGAKHWAKHGETPPPNQIIFTDFRLYQY